MAKIASCGAALGLLLLLGSSASAQQVGSTSEQTSDALADKLTPKFTITRSWNGDTKADPSDSVHFPVEFDYDSAVLRPQGQKQLDLLAESMNKVRQRTRSMVSAKQKLVLRLVGHTDDRGTDEYNDALSRGRAETAKKYLMAKWGFAESELAIDARGKREPVNTAQPCSDACRQQNRRVDVQVFVQ
jgi:outer membrane protein OmpA-like peptidoglycan-associated protein